MSNEESITMDKINLMAQNLPSELHDELYPKTLGKRVMMQDPDLRITVLAKYEGMGIILQKLGADISKLEAMIEEEGNKIITEKY